MKIVIITTALCRPEIHNNSFSSYAKILNGLDVKWFINVDNVSGEIKTSQKDTIANIHTHIGHFNPVYITSAEPCFFTAVKVLIRMAEDYLKNTENIPILWLEDDWVINHQFNIADIINRCFVDKCYISLVFNMVGSFPPFIMDKRLLEIMIPPFCRRKKPMNPEKLFRKTLHRVSLSNSIKRRYFLFDHIDDINTIELKKSLLTTEKRHYDDEIHYLVTDGKVPLNSCTEKEYKEIAKNGNYINIVHFASIRSVYSAEKYKFTYFRDIGREWKRINNI